MPGMTAFDPEQWLYDGVQVGGGDFSGQTLATIEAVDSGFEGLTLAGAILRRWAVERCRFTRCDLSNASLADSAFEDVHFSACKLVGVDFAQVRRVSFEARFVDCSLRLARFSGMSLRTVTFERCDLRDVDFAEADCRGVRFVECDLRGALFEQTNLRKADLTSARGVRIDPQQNRVEGARVDLAVAIAIAEAHGLIVER